MLHHTNFKLGQCQLLWRTCIKRNSKYIKLMHIFKSWNYVYPRKQHIHTYTFIRKPQHYAPGSLLCVFTVDISGNAWKLETIQCYKKKCLLKTSISHWHFPMMTNSAICWSFPYFYLFCLFVSHALRLSVIQVDCWHSYLTNCPTTGYNGQAQCIHWA